MQEQPFHTLLPALCYLLASTPYVTHSYSLCYQALLLCGATTGYAASILGNTYLGLVTHTCSLSSILVWQHFSNETFVQRDISLENKKLFALFLRTNMYIFIRKKEKQFLKVLHVKMLP